ncbi:hypothetical protein CEUSTIGMA_g3552.t1 [Chlamydomonas eustigma]|uniref:Methyltransferase type 11 domain-containing protein n=1 Tax=Chlamydomonas eustigma TaxID=1157962 RepID=A0A250WZI7_9CHLO|nr:hypothetical protein CEUSTIGMA_g3552.t1 [Chlamydomonas eustigma]|eukprot:GAX76109.1 hypothetical protein CEUSTIGMA_g3552.t1 [Chlamydomonas eustigma]
MMHGSVWSSSGHMLPHSSEHHINSQIISRFQARHLAPACKSLAREVLSKPQRMKIDETEDRFFYDYPRLVKHVDDGFIAQVTELYRQRIPAGGAVLDLCSSWVSHLPPEVEYSKVVGHGMNAAELARNERLDSFFVRNLNREPDGWAVADCTYDAVICCVSVQYLQQPERVFQEIHRVLKPGGVAIFTFSNRMFYGKAIAAWREGNDYARVQLVKQYFQCAEGFTVPEVLKQLKGPGASAPQNSLSKILKDLLVVLTGALPDPFFAVLSYKES